MFAAVIALMLSTAPDPRVPLVELQLAGRHGEALAEVERLIEQEPEAARELGLDYLHGHILESLDRWREAHRAFARSMDGQPQLAPYSLYRLALTETRLGHPEVAAGLLARLLSEGAPQPLVAPAVEQLSRFLAEGGDCGLLMDFDSWPLRGPPARRLELAAADCELARDQPQRAAERLLAMLRADPADEMARLAAERLEGLDDPMARDPEFALLLGETFHRHREFDRSTRWLLAALLPRLPASQLEPELEEALYHLARGHFWRGEYLLAASRFGQLAAALVDGRERARPLYQQGRSYELQGSWELAAQSFRLAYLADPAGDWAAAALLSVLRLSWRKGGEDEALELYELLGSRREWQRGFGRAALFLASSELVRRRTGRAGGWLDDAARTRSAEAPEIDYWRARLTELEGRTEAAIDRYLDTLASNPFHPFGRAAAARLARPELAERAAEIARRRAGSRQFREAYAATRLLGAFDPDGSRARSALERRLRTDARARTFLQLEPPPPADWPLWQARLRQPEERLLALGIWEEGATAVLKHFPMSDTALGFTGSWLLARARQDRRSLHLAEILIQRVPESMPVDMVAGELRRLVHPFPYRELIEGSAARHGVDPDLLAAIIREESRFDPAAVSAASARGLTQFVLPTARRVAGRLGMESLAAADLHRPPVSIELGAAYLAELAERFGGYEPAMLAAYNAGEPQAELWRSYCYSREPEEYLTKVGFSETRHYLTRVLESREQYRDLYRAAR